MNERKLAHIEIIESISPIPGADRIEVAKVLGWECVIKKGEFNVGDKIIFVEVDSVMPDLPQYDFLRSKNFRIKTIKLQKQVSQGLILPLPHHWTTKRPDRCQIGSDVTEELGITKYLSPSEHDEAYQNEKKLLNEKNKFKKFMMRYSWFRRLFLPKTQKFDFPYWVSKTEEERIQNLQWDKFYEQFKDKEIYVTEKIDYQSVTFTSKLVPTFNNWFGKLFSKKFQFIVCSRNMITNDKNNLYWQIAKKYNIEQILKENPTLTIQGEQGNTIVQGNKYGIKEPTMWVFNIIDHEKNYHYNYLEILCFCNKYNLNMVPILSVNRPISPSLSELGTTVQEFVEFSKGKSVINHNIEREGVVIRCIENGKKIFSFKVINPNFLLKYNE